MNDVTKERSPPVLYIFIGCLMFILIDHVMPNKNSDLVESNENKKKKINNRKKFDHPHKY